MKNYICPICGKQKSKNAKHCLSCEQLIRKQNSLAENIDMNFSLIEKILNSSIEEVAREYGYSAGSGLKKQLIKRGYPSTKAEMFSYYERITGQKHPKALEKSKKQENKEKNKPRRVGQYSLSGELIKIYNSSNQTKNDGYSSGHVVECCNGKRKKYRDFVWKYLS